MGHFDECHLLANRSEKSQMIVKDDAMEELINLIIRNEAGFDRYEPPRLDNNHHR